MNYSQYQAQLRQAQLQNLSSASRQAFADPNFRTRYELATKQADKQTSLANDANKSKFWTPDEKERGLNARNIVERQFAAEAVNSWQNAADGFLERPKPLKEQWDEYLDTYKVLPGPNDIQGWRVPPNLTQQEEENKRKQKEMWGRA